MKSAGWYLAALSEMYHLRQRKAHSETTGTLLQDGGAYWRHSQTGPYKIRNTTYKQQINLIGIGRKEYYRKIIQKIYWLLWVA
jgi:hypothetical protein